MIKFVDDVMDRNYDVKPLFQNIYILRSPRYRYLQITTIFLKTTFKDSKKVKGIRNYWLKRNLYLDFLIQQKLLISGGKMLMSAGLKGCVTWFICFLDVLYLRYNWAKFHHFTIGVPDFKEKDLFGPPTVISSKKTHPE